MNNKYLFTTGNTNGVGLEITLKSLFSSNDNNTKIIFCNKDQLNEHSKYLDLNYESFNIIKDYSVDLDPGVYFYTEGTPFTWFKDSVEYCSKNPRNSALITGPLSKDNFNDNNIKGHTSYLESVFKDSDLFMTFLGSTYSCLLLTDHIPLLKLNKESISNRLEKALNLLSDVSTYLNLDKPIAVLGLNPHSGENGLIGNEEDEIHKKIISKFENVKGPLPADGFFSKENYEKYSLLVANYHDQGLIPFKLIHGFNGCQTTLGLPFVRTSVNHGTATNLYLKNTADEKSLTEAYHAAIKLLQWRSINDIQS